jgi:hypothetical protein
MESSPLARKPCGTTQTREMKKIFDQAQNLVFDTPLQKKRFTTFFLSSYISAQGSSGYLAHDRSILPKTTLAFYLSS